MDWITLTGVANCIVAIAALCALYMTWKGWKNAWKTAREQSIMATNYTIYKDILIQVNDLVGKNSRYTVDLRAHIETTANMLNEFRGVGNFFEPADEKRMKELSENWAIPSIKIINNAYELKQSALELTRILDMSGADFGNNTKVYNALWLMYHDLNAASTEIQNRWTNLPLLDITVEQYGWLKTDTLKAIDVAEEFGSTVDDVLKHTYNQLVAEPMNKTKKEIDITVRRRIITLDGLRDNRVKDAA